jgi:hypothetical protein
METFLKKKARAHKYRELLTVAEVNAIVARHALRLKAIQILNFGPKTEWPEVTDEYHENEDGIIQDLKADLQKEFLRKIKLPKISDSAQALNHYLAGL